MSPPGWASDLPLVWPELTVHSRVVSKIYVNQGSKKLSSSHPGEVDSPSGQVPFQGSHLPTKSLKEQTKTCPGQAIFDRLSYWQDAM